jgi:hypothetical protein
MARYYVYDVTTGAIVHRHESFSVALGSSVWCSREDVLALVDPSLERETLEILEVEPGQDRAVRVDVEKRQLIETNG